MEKKKVLKIALVIIVVVLLLFLIITFRKFFILQEIQNNAKEYTSSVNFHKKVVVNENSITDAYQKEGKTAVKIESNGVKTSLYYTDDKCNVYYETSEAKTAKLNTNATLIGSLVTNYVETENIFLSSIHTNIEEVKLNEKECYCITGNLVSAFALADSNVKELYIDKDTGLCVKIVYDDGKTDEIEYEFGNVSDEIFIEPDIDEYEVLES